MVVTQLNLQFCFQGKKLRGFSCELTRSPHGVFPETVFSIMCQIMVPILLSGLGMLTASLVMNTIQHWPVFMEVKDLLTLVPPLVGLKGNLEMTLASRLSTAANTGQIDDTQEQHRVISSNLALIQVQATVVGFLAAVAALLLGAMSREELDFVKVELLCASSVITAFLAAFALGMLMVCIVIGARKLGINPDNNIAMPIAASLGDLITLSILAFVSSFFYKHKDNRYLTLLVCISFMALIPLWVLIVKQNPPIMRILKLGWFPVILAMVISIFGGLILNKTISKQQFQGMAIFTPIICGVGGNLVAIQTSWISTYLHVWSTPGVLPLWMKQYWPNPCSTFCTSEYYIVLQMFNGDQPLKLCDRGSQSPWPCGSRTTWTSRALGHQKGSSRELCMGSLGQTYQPGAGSLARPQENEDKHLHSTLITFPLDGNIECPLVLAAAISSASLCF
ncbi:solute carrier family 41 member 3-like [Panthera tigris]|uniref:solute carrier family 41 member 3-like n=1 Tax=Panthera tigris TaxID=9694 RepID=UPI001C6F985A|nr:solute carrier family 41 member 3-like [Panthera tigris]